MTCLIKNILPQLFYRKAKRIGENIRLSVPEPLPDIRLQSKVDFKGLDGQLTFLSLPSGFKRSQHSTASQFTCLEKNVLFSYEPKGDSPQSSVISDSSYFSRSHQRFKHSMSQWLCPKQAAVHRWKLLLPRCILSQREVNSCIRETFGALPGHYVMFRFKAEVRGTEWFWRNVSTLSCLSCQKYCANFGVWSFFHTTAAFSIQPLGGALHK